MIGHLPRIFWRGFAITTLTAFNVMQIARGHELGAFGCGFCISWVWWGTAHRAGGTNTPGARFCYALGAACGTWLGLKLGRVV